MPDGRSRIVRLLRSREGAGVSQCEREQEHLQLLSERDGMVEPPGTERSEMSSVGCIC